MCSLALLLLLLSQPVLSHWRPPLPALPSLLPIPIGPGPRLVDSYDSDRAAIPEVLHTCGDVIRKCNTQCNHDHQCKISCVACPNNARNKCWVKPDQCRLHSDG